MISEERRAYLREIGRKGGKTRALGFTREYQQAARAHVSSASCAANGHKGFIAAGGRIGWKRANRKAAQWRIEHPSEPERWALGVLEAAGVNHFVREHEIFDNGKTVDIAWPDAKVAVEVNGHQSKPSFGEIAPRIDKQNQKVDALRRKGWKVIVLDATADRDEQAQTLLSFIKEQMPI